MSHLSQPGDYEQLLHALKERIRTAQARRAAIAVNRELVLLYWQIGREILMRQQQQGWGAKAIDRLAKDLQKAFPHLKGLSPRNLKYMRAFAETYPDEPIVQAVLAAHPQQRQPIPDAYNHESSVIFRAEVTTRQREQSHQPSWAVAQQGDA